MDHCGVPPVSLTPRLALHARGSSSQVSGHLRVSERSAFSICSVSFASGSRSGQPGVSLRLRRPLGTGRRARSLPSWGAASLQPATRILMLERGLQQRAVGARVGPRRGGRPHSLVCGGTCSHAGGTTAGSGLRPRAKGAQRMKGVKGRMGSWKLGGLSKARRARAQVEAQTAELSHARREARHGVFEKLPYPQTKFSSQSPFTGTRRNSVTAACKGKTCIEHWQRPISIFLGSGEGGLCFAGARAVGPHCRECAPWRSVNKRTYLIISSSVVSGARPKYSVHGQDHYVHGQEERGGAFGHPTC